MQALTLSDAYLLSEKLLGSSLFHTCVEPNYIVCAFPEKQKIKVACTQCGLLLQLHQDDLFDIVYKEDGQVGR